jgi:hypothetical protein
LTSADLGEYIEDGDEKGLTPGNEEDGLASVRADDRRGVEELKKKSEKKRD